MSNNLWNRTTFEEVKFTKQNDSDCGYHMLINMELLVNKLNPSVQTFTPFLIQKIRYYHSLLYSKNIKEFRLGLEN